MRIALVHSYYSSASPSGENTSVDNQAKALTAAGHEVFMVTRYTDTEQKNRLYHLRAFATAAGLGGNDITDELAAIAPDVVHVHNLFPNISTAWLDIWGHRTVATLHNHRSICANGLLWRSGSDCYECPTVSSMSAIKHRCYRDSVIATLPLAFATRGNGNHSAILQKANTVVVLNSRAKDIYQQQRPDRPVEVVHNFTPQEPAATTLRSSKDWVYAGRLTPEKGIIRLLTDWPSGHNLTVIGSGPLEDEVARVAAPRTDIDFRGAVSNEEVRYKLRSAAGLILPSLWSEGLPTVALESLSAGTPLVVSLNCASAETLTANGAGMIYDPSSPESLRTALKSIEKSTTYSKQAHKLYQHEFSSEAWVSRMQQIYAKVATISR